jgi:HK97 family phage portal protein
MGFMQNRFFQPKNETIWTANDERLLNLIGITGGTLGDPEFGETIYFIALNHLAQTMSKLSRYQYQTTKEKGRERIYESEWMNVINLEPNPLYTASTLWASVELNRLHTGNGYVYIEESGTGQKALWVLPSHEVQVYIDDAGIFDKLENGEARNKGQNVIWYIWNDGRSKKRFAFASYEILHYKTHISLDGITGLATKDILTLQIESLKKSEEYQNKLFASNMFGGKVLLNYTGDMNNNAKDVLIKNTERYANSVGSGKFIPLPSAIEAKLMDMKLADAEFVDLNKLNGLQLAACFGIKPNIINDYSKSSHSNSETQQLDFYVNSLQPIFKMYNDETTRKLLSIQQKKENMCLEIDKEALFELDKKTQMEIMAKGVNNFIVSPNEAREKVGLSHWPEKSADKLYGNGNLISIENAGNGQNYKGVK